jgi:hypothetical protein
MRKDLIMEESTLALKKEEITATPGNAAKLILI